MHSWFLRTNPFTIHHLRRITYLGLVDPFLLVFLVGLDIVEPPLVVIVQWGRAITLNIQTIEEIHEESVTARFARP